jgi:phosphohistidine phosphatase SixA
MKYFLPLFFASILLACNTTKIYVVRHAEKAATTGDPGLTTVGQQRAEALKDKLHTQKIVAAFATQYQRTLETAQPTATDQQITIRRYDANGGNALMDSISHLKKKEYLVVGHSNTVPVMLRSIGVNPSIELISDNDYDNFFTVTVRWFLGRKVSLSQGTYGDTSP